MCYYVITWVWPKKINIYIGGGCKKAVFVTQGTSFNFLKPKATVFTGNKCLNVGMELWGHHTQLFVHFLPPDTGSIWSALARPQSPSQCFFKTVKKSFVAKWPPYLSWRRNAWTSSSGMSRVRYSRQSPNISNNGLTQTNRSSHPARCAAALLQGYCQGSSTNSACTIALCIVSQYIDEPH